MLKYSTSIVEDYIEGNDIEDFDIDELENDRSFMLDVIKKTKDKNFYNLCSDDLKHDYEFVSALLDMFKDDTKFIVSVADEFVSYFRSESIGPMISDEDERDVLDVLMTVCDLIPDKYDKSSFKYRVILSVNENDFLEYRDSYLKYINEGYKFILYLSGDSSLKNDSIRKVFSYVVDNDVVEVG